MEGKVALISGAAAGIKSELMGFGGTVAWMFLNEGAKVVLGDINDALGERAPDSEATTVFAHAFSWDECRQEVPAVFPYLQDVFEQDLPEDGFLAISVTAGGASVLTVPFEVRESIDD